MKQELAGILQFLRAAEALKDTLRSATTRQGRTESTAEHSWRLCLLALLLEERYPELDGSRLIQLCIVHDLGEALNGDIPAIEQQPGVDKSVDERRDLQTLAQPLPPALREKILALWDEYENAVSPEAKLAKALDKIETLLQHSQGDNPPDFDYGFNLTYGSVYTDLDAITRHLRALIDERTEQLARDNGTL